jgi:hypothetical protein
MHPAFSAYRVSSAFWFSVVCPLSLVDTRGVDRYSFACLNHGPIPFCKSSNYYTESVYFVQMFFESRKALFCALFLCRFRRGFCIGGGLAQASVESRATAAGVGRLMPLERKLVRDGQAR